MCSSNVSSNVNDYGSLWHAARLATLLPLPRLLLTLANEIENENMSGFKNIIVLNLQQICFSSHCCCCCLLAKILPLTILPLPFAVCHFPFAVFHSRCCFPVCLFCCCCCCCCFLVVLLASFDITQLLWLDVCATCVHKIKHTHGWLL